VTSPFVDPDENAGGTLPAIPPRPMAPRARGSLRAGHKPQAIPLRGADESWHDDPAEEAPRSRRQDLDPIFGYILAMALSVGLTPLPANTRYVVLWAFMAIMGVMAFLLGSGIKLKVADPGDLVGGLVLGILTGGALLLVGSDTLRTASERLFGAKDASNPLLVTWVFQAAVFVMPFSESLFFRGAMQRGHPILVVALMASAWSGLMFFPNLELAETPAVGAVFGTALVLLNFLYSYVSFRNGLAASLLCQVAAGSLILLVPLLISL